jgi:hypothetical protein
MIGENNMFAVKIKFSEDQFTSTDDKFRYKVCSFHGGDYEVCRLLGYKNPVRIA